MRLVDWFKSERATNNVFDGPGKNFFKSEDKHSSAMYSLTTYLYASKLQLAIPLTSRSQVTSTKYRKNICKWRSVLLRLTFNYIRNSDVHAPLGLYTSPIRMLKVKLNFLSGENTSSIDSLDHLKCRTQFCHLFTNWFRHPKKGIYFNFQLFSLLLLTFFSKFLQKYVKTFRLCRSATYLVRWVVHLSTHIQSQLRLSRQSKRHFHGWSVSEFN